MTSSLTEISSLILAHLSDETLHEMVSQGVLTPANTVAVYSSWIFLLVALEDRRSLQDSPHGIRDRHWPHSLSFSRTTGRELTKQ